MNNIANNFLKESCCGCGACVNACPFDAISYDKDEYGFIVPKVNSERCVSCGKCIQVCPYRNLVPSYESDFSPVTYAATNIDSDVVKNSSSGGIFFSLAQSVIEKSGVVFGAIMDSSFNVHHAQAETILELASFQKSKYVQSFLDDTYSKVKSFLLNERFVLFSGTPCQVAGLHSFLRNKKYDNLLTVEVVCHGVPSQDLFNDYLKSLESKVGKIKEYSFRYKSKSANGMKWYSSYLTEKKRYIRNWPEDSFNYYYMQSLVYRDSCYTCKFASARRNADITLCDYWHWNNLHKKDFKDGSSVSGIIVNTPKGSDFLNRISTKFKLVKSDFEYLSSHNSCLIHPCGMKKDRVTILNKWKREGYIVLDENFKRKHRAQIIKYKILRHLPNAFLTISHKIKSWISK